MNTVATISDLAAFVRKFPYDLPPKRENFNLLQKGIERRVSFVFQLRISVFKPFVERRVVIFIAIHQHRPELSSMVLDNFHSSCENAIKTWQEWVTLSRILQYIKHNQLQYTTPKENTCNKAQLSNTRVIITIPTRFLIENRSEVTLSLIRCLRNNHVISRILNFSLRKFLVDGKKYFK